MGTTYYQSNTYAMTGLPFKSVKSVAGNQREQAHSSLTETNTIIVKNVPESADEELLEVFFESTKKQGGGPVKSVKILGDKQPAFVEFLDSSSVKTVLKKRPIKLGKAELDVQPFQPLLHGSEKIKYVRIDLIELSGIFTEDGFLKQQLEYLDAALIKVGSRVVRGRDWDSKLFNDQDGGPGGQGTVTRIDKIGRVDVKWDSGYAGCNYNMGKDGKYRLKLVPLIC